MADYDYPTWNNGYDLPGGGDTPTTPNFKLNGLGDLYQLFSNGLGGMLGMDDPMSNAMLAPAMTAAWKQWNDASKYRDSGERAVEAGQPYKDRDYYAGRLKQMTEDPNAYLENSPDYKAALNQGLQAVTRTNEAKGNAYSGNMLTALNDYSAETATKYLDRDRQSLMALAKGNPNAGNWIMDADKNAIDSENQALNSLFLPFLMQQQARTANPANTTKKIPDDITNLIKTLPNAAQTALNNAIKAGDWTKVSSLWRSMGGGDEMDYLRTEDPNGRYIDDHYDLPLAPGYGNDLPDDSDNYTHPYIPIDQFDTFQELFPGMTQEDFTNWFGIDDDMGGYLG